jgi:phospholipid:diacylglycerol acyltransferase
MDSARRRHQPAAGTPRPGESTVAVVPVALLPRPTRHRRRTGFIFALGGLFGVVLAAFFASRQDVISLDGLLDLNLESLIDVIPSRVLSDARELSVRGLTGVARWC